MKLLPQGDIKTEASNGDENIENPERRSLEEHEGDVVEWVKGKYRTIYRDEDKVAHYWSNPHDFEYPGPRSHHEGYLDVHYR